MTLLSRADILAADDILTKIISVPAWGGEVRIKAWSVAEADSFAKLMVKSQDENGFFVGMREHACLRSIIDENGNPMFTLKDIEKLGKKSPAALDFVFTEITKLNKLKGGEKDEAGEPGNA